MGVAIFAAFGLTPALLMVFVYDKPVFDIATIMFQRIYSYPLLAMPFFMLTGNLLAGGGTVEKGIELFDAWTGHFPGGLAIVTVLFSTVFAAITGSSIAAVIAIGSIMHPHMLEHGYSRGFSAGIICCAALLGPIIPPSTGAIIMGSLMELSVASLFACGMIPGLIVSSGLLILSITRSIRAHVPVKESASWGTRVSTMWKAIPLFIMPIVILGGIYGGFVSPTEAATLACVLALLNGLVFYRKLSLRKMWDAFIRSAKGCGVIYVVMAGIQPFAYVLLVSGAAANITEALVATGVTPFVFVLMLTAMYFVLGFFVPPFATMLSTIPIIDPILMSLGINEYWYSTIWRLNMGVAMTTPPFAFLLFVASSVLDVPFGEVVKGVIPFIPIQFAVMIAIIFYPQIALWLPGIMGLPVGLFPVY